MPDIGQIPTWAILGVALSAVAALATVLLLRHRAADRQRRPGRALTIAAIAATLPVFGSVFAVSFLGLTDFARADMGFDGIAAYVVPVTLDGISVGYGAFAFIQVRRGQYPGRAHRIVGASMLVSAGLNAAHAYTYWSPAAAVYMAFLSIMCMALFHEFLYLWVDQIDDNALSSRSPRFGLRWLLAPMSTFAAWRSWQVHPVPAVVLATRANALQHHNRVRSVRGKTATPFVVYTQDDLSEFQDGLRPESAPRALLNPLPRAPRERLESAPHRAPESAPRAPRERSSTRSREHPESAPQPAPESTPRAPRERSNQQLLDEIETLLPPEKMPPSKRFLKNTLRIGWERTEQLHSLLEERSRQLNGHEHR